MSGWVLHQAMAKNKKPTLSFACAWWLFNDTPSYRMLAGATIIVLAIVFSPQGHSGPTKVVAQ